MRLSGWAASKRSRRRRPAASERRASWPPDLPLAVPDHARWRARCGPLGARCGDWASRRSSGWRSAGGRDRIATVHDERASAAQNAESRNEKPADWRLQTHPSAASAAGPREQSTDLAFHDRVLGSGRSRILDSCDPITGILEVIVLANPVSLPVGGGCDALMWAACVWTALTPANLLRAARSTKAVTPQLSTVSSTTYYSRHYS